MNAEGSKGVLITLVGIPGSGKSTYANKVKYKTDSYIIISSDAIRKELFGDENIQGDNNKIFFLVHERIRKELSKDKLVVFDATNINVRNRKKVFEDGAGINIAVFFDVPVEECKRRNANRKRTVPDYVIDRMANNLVPPTVEEGFDAIYVHK